MNDWTIRNTETGQEWYADSRSEAEGRIEDMAGYVDPDDFEIVPPNSGNDDADDQEPEPEATQPDPAPEPGDSESTPDREDTTPAPNKSDETDDGTEAVTPEVVDQTEDDTSHPQGPPQRTTGEMEVSEDSEQSEAPPAPPQEAQQEAPQPAGSYDLPERNVGDDPLEWVPGDFVDDIDGTQAINRKGFEVLSHFYDITVRSEVQVAPEETDFEFARCKAVAVDPDGRECEAHGSAHIDRGDDKPLLLEMADTRARKRALSIATGVGAVAVAELKNEVGA